jgi:hypothetical protein
MNEGKPFPSGAAAAQERFLLRLSKAGYIASASLTDDDCSITLTEKGRSLVIYLQMFMHDVGGLPPDEWAHVFAFADFFPDLEPPKK